MIETGNTLVLIRPKRITNVRGDIEFDYSPAAVTRFPIYGRIVVEPGASKETWGDRDLTSIEWTARIFDHLDISEHDHVELDGVEYAIDGHPQRFTSPTRRLNHVVLALTKWRGA